MERLVHHLLSMSVLMIERQSPGDLIEAVREDVQRLRTALVAIATIVVRSLTATALVASAIWLSPRLAAVSFPVLAIALGPMAFVARRVRRRTFGLRRNAYRVFDVLLQMLRGIRVIKVYRGERAEADRASGHMRTYFGELLSITRNTAFAQSALEAVGGFSLVIIVIVGGFQVLGGVLTWPALLAFLMAIRATQGPIAQMNQQYLLLQRSSAALHRLHQLFNVQSSPRDAADAEPLERPIEHVAFDRVSFAYEAGTTALSDVSFNVSRGEVLGIVGPSAAGKTTLLNLTARFFDPTRGAVLVNGRDVRRYRLADLYEQIAIVTQDPFLFSTTVRENIRCGRPDASDAEVEAAARAAEIHDDIVALPTGYDTPIGMGHRGLSGGQIQRVNIARAILKNAPLLLLDEATSSLDSIAEERIQRAITRLMHGRTTLVVAHRLSTLRNATRIAVLDAGQVVSIGTHDELFLRSGLYRRMWNAQSTSHTTTPAPGTTTGIASSR
jgi:subfamily B ATP-binding cassette protein MsbA